MFNICDYGAQGDKITRDTTAIQAALDACASTGGGTVHVPTGNYLSGNLELKSHTTLHLDAGATIWVSPDPADYPEGKRHLLTARDACHIALVGQGVIHGQAMSDYGSRWGAPDRPAFRTGILLFEECQHVSIRDVSMLYCDSWTVHLKRCDTVFIDGLTIFNNVRRLNSDGIDPNSCRNVHISNCCITSGDDCIVFKATEQADCENIVVTNCTLETTCAALKLGTESRGNFRNIQVSNCTISDTPVGIGFYMKDGATMERVSFSNIAIETAPQSHVVCPVFMDIEKRHEDSGIGTIRDVSFRDLLIQSGSGILIQGMPESPIQNLSMQNVILRVSDPEDYTRRSKPAGGRRTTRDSRDTLYARKPSYLTLAHVEGFVLADVRVAISEEAFERSPRSAVAIYRCSDGIVRHAVRRPTAGNPPAIVVEESSDVQIE